MSTPTPDPESIADPGPLGLAAFAATTFVLSTFNANLITDKSLVARSVNRSTPRRGCGTASTSAATAVRSSTPGGRRRPAPS
ncbi:GPR1/FUN34/YaaH family transporter [Streptomyces sviceus]|uniref:GPR1/FUN34/YaaH family transporter n=1 Tax=Streptomyces sviceus TaxID=285530 RepID=UPI003327C8C5